MSEQQSDDAFRSSRKQQSLPQEHISHVDRRKPVSILEGEDGIDDEMLAHLLWKGKLDDEAVNLLVLVHLINRGDDFGLGSVRAQQDLLGDDPNLLAGLDFPFDIHFRGRIVAHQHHSKAGLRLHARNLLLHLLPELGREILSVKQLRGHKRACLTMLWSRFGPTETMAAGIPRSSSIFST